MGLKFATMWFGNKPTLLQQISWNSYIYHGHELNVYLYDMSIDVPDGVIKKDANEIMLEKDVYLPKIDKGLPSEGHAQFADIFRLYMLKKTDFIWTDSDVVCLKEVWPDREPYLAGFMMDQPEELGGPIRVNNDILYIGNEEILDEMLNYIKNSTKDCEDDELKFGPTLLTDTFSKNDLMHFVKEENVFHAVRYAHIDRLILPEHFEKTMDLIKDKVAVSLFASSWLKNKRLHPPANSTPIHNSVIGYLANKYVYTKKSSTSLKSLDVEQTKSVPVYSEFDENSNPWFTKDRSETASNRVPLRKLNENISAENLGLGLHVYHNTFSLEDSKRYIDTLESNLGNNGKYQWSEAKVTNSDQPIKKARDCVDFKYKQENLGPKDESNSELIDLHEEIYQKLKYCIDDYAKYWGINVTYYEAFNFVKYEGEGTHFNIHADHGPAYICTVSAVIYINDDYEGGELKFPRLDNLVIKPRVGDIAVFPSNYIYEHASLPMQSGTKYCVVIMTDINEIGHK